MLTVVSEFFVIAMTAIVLQNAVLTRALGMHKKVVMMTKPKNILLYGGCLTLVTFVSSFLSYFVATAVKELPYQIHIRSFSFLLCIMAVYFVFHFTVKSFFPKLFFAIQDSLPFAAFNSAVFGAMYISAQHSYTLSQTLGFGLGTGIGFTLAILITCECRQRLALSDTPRAFKGLPITLLYLGILSLAIYGLIGHQLPT